MTASPLPPIDAADRDILRELAKRHREAADSPRNSECVRLWRAHDAVGAGAGRPLILAEANEGPGMADPDFRVETRHPWAQAAENSLKTDLLHFHLIGDDYPIEPFVNAGWSIRAGGYGVDFSTDRGSDGAAGRGAYHIPPALPDFPDGLEKVRVRDFAVDRAGTLARKAALEEVFEGILGVRMRGGSNVWTYGLTQEAIRFTGLDGFMTSMYDEPEALHRLMGILRDDRAKWIEWQEAEGLLTLNNENDYVGSGSRGYTARLPADPAAARGEKPARAKDLWALLESQETAGVGPAQYAEFVFPYEEASARRFGSTYYGCCEPVHGRWEVIRKMSGLARVSVSPWCDEEYLAAAFGKEIVYSRKPNPTLVSTPRFDAGLIRADLRHTMEITRRHGCRTEIVMKDVHTLAGEHDRLRRWTQIAREVISGIYG